MATPPTTPLDPRYQYDPTVGPPPPVDPFQAPIGGAMTDAPPMEAPPTMDGGATPFEVTPTPLALVLSESELLDLCLQYKNEAISGRESGDAPRDERWEANLDMYWRRMDYSDKEE